MATAAEVPVMRTELVDLLRLPTHANAILTLENLISAGDENVSASGVLCVHNLLWPSTNENLNFCGSFLYLNRCDGVRGAHGSLCTQIRRLPSLQMIEARERPKDAIKEMLSSLASKLSPEANPVVRLRTVCRLLPVQPPQTQEAGKGTP
eukprot:982635-Prorocentrum_minimum.AAC.1